MPRSVDLLIASEDPLEALAEGVSAIEGVEVAPATDGSWTVRDGEVTAVLAPQRDPGGGDLPWRRYRYALSAQVPDAVRPQDSAPATLLRRVGEKLQHDRSVMVLMVLDRQYRAVGGPPEVPA